MAFVTAVMTAVQAGVNAWQSAEDQRRRQHQQELARHGYGRRPPYVFYRYREGYVFVASTGEWVPPGGKADDFSRQYAGDGWWVDHTVNIPLNFGGFEERGGKKFDKNWKVAREAMQKVLAGQTVTPSNAPEPVQVGQFEPAEKPKSNAMPLLLGAYLAFKVLS